jgi:hypothetical protein
MFKKKVFSSIPLTILPFETKQRLSNQQNLLTKFIDIDHHSFNDIVFCFVLTLQIPSHHHTL